MATMQWIPPALFQKTQPCYDHDGHGGTWRHTAAQTALGTGRIMKVYGLTGGIASGKSEVSRHFTDLGVPVIDADEIAHSVIEPGGAAEQGVLAAFGRGILTCDRIDREKLGAIVFDDREARHRLNGLVHPAVGREFLARTEAYGQDGHEAVVYDAALLAEDGTLRDGFAGLMVVICGRTERLRRLVELRGMNEEDAAKRIDAQTPPEKKIPLAKWVIDNSGSLDELHRQVEGIAKEL